MARIQIITSDENGGGNACEALWYEFAEAAAADGHHVTALIAGRSAANSRIVAMKDAGVCVRHRWSEPNRGRLRRLGHKVWQRTGACWSLPALLSDKVDFRLLNFGTMVEAARKPWASLLTRSHIPYGVLVHSNSEIRDYPAQLRQRLRVILGEAARVYFVSKRLWDNAEEQLLMRIRSAKVVRNPVNLQSRQAEAWPQQNECLRMAVVGRLDAFVKGHIRLLHALSDEKWKKRDWNLSIFGSGPNKNEIEGAAVFYGLAQRVELKGFVDDVREKVWRTHHLLVMPSMLEGMPLTLVEGMMCGRPALCSDVGGASELIRDGHNGFLAGSPFAGQLAIGLERVWEHRYELERMGRKAHDDALSFVPKKPGERLLADVMEAVKER
jgi:glycosyltransferase involved in cell wall biosynthesis